MIGPGDNDYGREPPLANLLKAGAAGLETPTPAMQASVEASIKAKLAKHRESACIDSLATVLRETPTSSFYKLADVVLTAIRNRPERFLSFYDAGDAVQMVFTIAEQKNRLAAQAADVTKYQMLYTLMMQSRDNADALVTKLHAEKTAAEKECTKLLASLSDERNSHKFIEDRASSERDAALRELAREREQLAACTAALTDTKAQLSENHDCAAKLEKIIVAFDMCMKAWRRELGEFYTPKMHEVDALVLATRKIVAREKEAGAKVEMLTEELAGLRREMAHRYDCHGGPGTSIAACKGCATCLNNECARLAAELLRFDCRKIMLNVVPGDGEGYEVYAKSREDIEEALSKLQEDVEQLQSRVIKLPDVVASAGDQPAFLQHAITQAIEAAKVRWIP